MHPSAKAIFGSQQSIRCRIMYSTAHQYVFFESITTHYPSCLSIGCSLVGWLVG